MCSSSLYCSRYEEMSCTHDGRPLGPPQVTATLGHKASRSRLKQCCRSASCMDDKSATANRGRNSEKRSPLTPSPDYHIWIWGPAVHISWSPSRPCPAVASSATRVTTLTVHNISPQLVRWDMFLHWKCLTRVLLRTHATLQSFKCARCAANTLSVMIFTFQVPVVFSAPHAEILWGWKH